jgi:hypothetical protein
MLIAKRRVLSKIMSQQLQLMKSSLRARFLPAKFILSFFQSMINEQGLLLPCVDADEIKITMKRPKLVDVLIIILSAGWWACSRTSLRSLARGSERRREGWTCCP